MAAIGLLNSAVFKSHHFKSYGDGIIFKSFGITADLVQNSSPTLDLTDFLLYNSSIFFDGVDDYYTYVNTTSINLNGPNKDNATLSTAIHKISSALSAGLYGIYSLFVDANNYESLLLEVYTSGVNRLRYRYKLVAGGVTIYDLTSASIGTVTASINEWKICNISISDQVPYINTVSFAGSATAATLINPVFNLGRAYLDGQYYYYNGNIDTLVTAFGLLYNNNYTVATAPGYDSLDSLETQLISGAAVITAFDFIYPRVIPQDRGNFSTNSIDNIIIGNNLWTLGWQDGIGGNDYGIFFDFEILSTFTLAVSAGGALTASTTYYYAITALDTESGVESCLSGVKSAATTVGNQTITINNVFNTRNPTLRSSTTHLVKRIYRSTDNRDFKYIATIAWNTNTYVDNGGANTGGHFYVPSNFIGFVPHSLQQPPAPTTGVLFGTGITGTFAYITTNYDPLTGIESPCSPESASVSPANQTIPINYTGGLGNGYYLRIYRRNIGAGSAYWFLLTELTTGVTAGVFNDNIPESSLSSVRITDRTLLNLNAFTHRDVCSYHLDRLWFAVNNRIYYSQIGRYSTISPNAYIDILDGEGPITALYSFLNTLVIFKEKTVLLLVGNTAATFTIINISKNTSIGVSSKWTIKEIANKLIFANGLGVYAYNGSTFDTLSDGIKDIFTSNLKQQQRGVMTAALDNENKYYLLGLRLTDFDENVLVTPRVNCNVENDTILAFDFEAYELQNKKTWYVWAENTLYLTEGQYLFDKLSSVIVGYENSASIISGTQNGGNPTVNIAYNWESNPTSVNPFRVNRVDHLKFTLDTSGFTTTKTVNVGFIVSNVTTNVSFNVLAQEDLEIKPSTRTKFIQAKISGNTDEKLIVIGFSMNTEVTGFR